MRHRIAPVKNIKLLAQAGEALKMRAPTTPGIGLLYAATGAGKSTAATYYANKSNAIYVRAVATWTPSAMLHAICRELEIQPVGSAARMLDTIARHLAVENRPLFVDEADYLMSTKKLVETVRDIHDISTCPILLIGMAEFKRKVIQREQLAGRIAQWVEFRPADIEDADTLAKHVCEVDLDKELLRKLHVDTRGSMRGMVVGLSHIETLAKRLGKKAVTLEEWGDRDFTLSTVGSSKRVDA